MPVFEKGVLKTYYLDTYYAKKLSMEPTTGGMSNLVYAMGTRRSTASSPTQRTASS